MVLKIYEKKNVVKIYTADTYDLMFGTLEDVLNALNIDDMQTGSDAETVKMAVNFVRSNISLVCDLLKDIFDGITDKEIRHAKTSDIAVVLVDVVKYAFSEIRKGVSTKK